MLSGENRPSDASPADAAPAAAGAATAPNPPLVCEKELKPLAIPPPVPAVEEKLNPEAEPNPEEAAGLLAFSAVKEKFEGLEAEDPNAEGGCAEYDESLPKPVEDVGAEEPNPVCWDVKLKLLAWTGAAAPKPA